MQHASCSNRLTTALQGLVQDVGRLATVVSVEQSTDAALQSLPLLQAPPPEVDASACKLVPVRGDAADDRRALAAGLENPLFDSSAASDANTSTISAYAKPSGEFGACARLLTLSSCAVICLHHKRETSSAQAATVLVHCKAPQVRLVKFSAQSAPVSKLLCAAKGVHGYLSQQLSRAE